MSTTTEQSGQPQIFEIQKLYIKDVSFESPQAPAVFQTQWQPETNMQVGTQSTRLSENTHEVVLNLTITVKKEEQSIFLIEVEQAGIFTVENFPEEAMGHLLGSYCPNILFPYAREAISDLTTKGGFPPLLLAPINFDALYAQQQEAATAETTA